jgi:hypothetical protein
MTMYAKMQKVTFNWINTTLGKIDHGLTFNGALLALAQFMESWLLARNRPAVPAPTVITTATRSSTSCQP